MSSSGPGELVRIDGRLNAKKYIDILDNILIPGAIGTQNELFERATEIWERAAFYTQYWANLVNSAPDRLEFLQYFEGEWSPF